MHFEEVFDADNESPIYYGPWTSLASSTSSQMKQDDKQIFFTCADKISKGIWTIIQCQYQSA